MRKRFDGVTLILVAVGAALMVGIVATSDDDHWSWQSRAIFTFVVVGTLVGVVRRHQISN